MSPKQGAEQVSAQADEDFDAVPAPIGPVRQPASETTTDRHVVGTAKTVAPANGSHPRSNSDVSGDGRGEAVADEIRAVFAAVMGTRPGNIADAPSAVLQMTDLSLPTDASAIDQTTLAPVPLHDIAAFVDASSTTLNPTFQPHASPKRLQTGPDRGRAKSAVGLCIAGLAIGVLAGALYMSSADKWLQGALSTAHGPDKKAPVQTTRAAALAPAGKPAPAASPASVPVAQPAVQQPARAEPLAQTPPGEVPARPPATVLQTTTTIGQADQLLRAGDIAGARDLLKSLAQAKQPEAMFLLGRSFDPLFIKTLPSANAAGDASTAIRLYRMTAAAGHADAARQHNALMQHIMQ